MIPDFRQPAFFEQLRSQRHHERSAYLIAICAMQRGLEVRFYRTQAEAGTRHALFAAATPYADFFSVSDGRKRHLFSGAQIDTATRAAAVTVDKLKTKQLLHARNLNTPVGGLVSSDKPQLLHDLARAGVQRFAIKAIAGSHGKGIFLGQAVQQVEAYLKTHPKQPVLVEQQIRGREYRIYVIGNEAVDAYRYTPAHVVGTGTDTVRSLFEARDDRRKKSPFLVDRLPDPAEMEIALLGQKLQWESVPAKGQVVWLAVSSIPDTQGDFVNAMDEIPAGMRQLAVDAARAVASQNCALDMILAPSGEAYVLEINIRAMFAALCFPHPVGEYNLRVPHRILDTVFARRAGAELEVTGFDFAAMKAEVFREGRSSKGVAARDYVTFG